MKKNVIMFSLFAVIETICFFMQERFFAAKYVAGITLLFTLLFLFLKTKTTIKTSSEVSDNQEKEKNDNFVKYIDTDGYNYCIDSGRSLIFKDVPLRKNGTTSLSCGGNLWDWGSYILEIVTENSCIINVRVWRNGTECRVAHVNSLEPLSFYFYTDKEPYEEVKFIFDLGHYIKLN